MEILTQISKTPSFSETGLLLIYKPAHIVMSYMAKKINFDEAADKLMEGYREEFFMQSWYLVKLLENASSKEISKFRKKYFNKFRQKNGINQALIEHLRKIATKHGFLLAKKENFQPKTNILFSNGIREYELACNEQDSIYADGLNWMAALLGNSLAADKILLGYVDDYNEGKATKEKLKSAAIDFAINFGSVEGIYQAASIITEEEDPKKQDLSLVENLLEKRLNGLLNLKIYCQEDGELYNLFRIKLINKDYLKAKEIFEKLYDILKLVPSVSDIVKYISIINKDEELPSVGQLRIKSLINELQKRFNEMLPVDKLYIGYLVANGIFTDKDPMRAATYWEKGLFGIKKEGFKKPNKQKLYVYALENIMGYYVQSKIRDTAKVLNIINRLLITDPIRHKYFGLANLYYNINYFDDALKYCNLALESNSINMQYLRELKENIEKTLIEREINNSQAEQTSNVLATTSSDSRNSLVKVTVSLAKEKEEIVVEPKSPPRQDLSKSWNSLQHKKFQINKRNKSNKIQNHNIINPNEENNVLIREFIKTWLTKDEITHPDDLQKALDELTLKLNKMQNHTWFHPYHGRKLSKYGYRVTEMDKKSVARQLEKLVKK